MPTMFVLEEHTALFRDVEARRAFAAILTEAYEKEEMTIMTHKGKLLAAFMSPTEVVTRLRKRASDSSATTVPIDKTPEPPLRITVKEAARRLSCSPDIVYDLTTRGVLTRMAPNGKTGRGQRFYLLPEEIRVYGEGGELAVKQYQQTKKRRPPR